MEAVPEAPRQIGATGIFRGAPEEEAVTRAEALQAGVDHGLHRRPAVAKVLVERLRLMVAIAARPRGIG
jgi:hypothetical protein